MKYVKKEVIPVLLLLLCLTGIVPKTQAQEIIHAKGVVQDSSGRRIEGVDIVGKSSILAVSDSLGNFDISAIKGSPLQFRKVDFVMATQDASTNMIVTLINMRQDLDAVVVVGYGSQKKRELTGSTVSISGENLEKNHTVDAMQGLQGQAAGVQVTATNGQPGASLKVRIRGIGTNGDSNPLYVVDGMPTDDISYLNSADIQSMDILKDAASTAIYGTRGANGVVMITTKKGRPNQKLVTLDAYYGIQNPARKMSLLNGREYANVMNEAAMNSGMPPYYFYSQKFIDSIGNGTDWQKAAQNKNAPIQNYTLGFSGGNSESVYSSSLSYQKQEGIIGLPGRSMFERFTFKINSDHKVYKDIIKFGENLNYSHSTQRGLGTGNIYGNAIRGLVNTNPTFPVYNPGGSYAKSPNLDETNPIALMDYTNINKTIKDRILGNTYLQVNFLKNLQFRSDFGIDLTYFSTNTFTPVYNLSNSQSNANSQAGQGLFKIFAWNWDNTLQYSLKSNNHSLTALVGTTAKEDNSLQVYGTKQDLVVSDFNHAVINAATNNLTQKIFGNIVSSSLNSYFGRVNYSFASKYLFTAIVRRDGSSRFGPNNRWGTFPSLSAGWIATSEDFMKNISWLNFLKIRAGWGKNGNDRINNYLYMATISSYAQGYYFGGAGNQTISVGASPDKIPNQNLKWEASQQANLGFDATLFRNLTLSFDWYNKQTKDWLVQVPVPDLVGTAAPYINGGNIINKGVEVALNYKGNISDFQYSLGGNIAINRNRAASIPTADGIIHGSTNILSSSTEEFYRIQNGFPIGYFWGYKTSGVFQTQDQINSYVNSKGALLQPDAKPGDVIFKDLNHDGVIDNNDKTMIGNPNPKFTYGFTFSASYKGFDLSIMTNGVYGNQIINGNRALDRYFNNYDTEILKSWHGQGSSNYLPRVTMGDEPNGNWSRISDLYVQSGSFFRIKTINIGYNFENTILNQGPFKQLRLYISTMNPFTFTKYRGIDPEVGYGNESWSNGIDLGTYPQPRTFMVGLSAHF